ncbi:MAG: ATP-binding protein [Thermodesulfovibrionales bacterium]|nr:ATP-binding protein [Thermodesulfovibrionales bacterium]
MIKDYFLRLSLNKKLVLMMLFLNLSLIAALIFLYYQTEKAIYSEFERHITELTKAIRLGMEEVTSGGTPDEKRLQNYLKKLNTKGVREISLISTSDRIVSSTNPGNVGKWITKQKKELIFKAELGEPVTGREQDFDVIVPVMAGEKHLGYVHLSMNTEDFSVFMQRGVIRRVIAASAVFGIGIILAVFLAGRYTRPIEDVVRAAKSVAGGDLSQRLQTDRKDEIGELTGSFNYMVGKLREEQELRERLRKAEHFAGMGQFSSSIAHEIRNPLNFISLSIDHIRERYAPEALEDRTSFNSLILNIKKEIQRVSGFAEGFLDFSRPIGLNLRRTDMGGLIKGVIELVSAKAEKEGIKIERHYKALPELDADADLIKTCLYNIILNSFQAMPGGGSLRIGTEASGGMLSISVSDTGSGIPEDKAARVFEPFFTTKDKGLGLGLSLTKRVIEEHGGAVEFKSAEGKGSTVTITLPLAQEA